MKRHELILTALFTISPIAFCPLSQWMATAVVGTDLFLWATLIYAMLMLIFILAIPVLIFRLFYRQQRREALLTLLLGLAFIPCFILGAHLGHKVRTAAMLAFTHRSQPLIAAIQKFERDHSAPPKVLTDLVPDYLPAVPSTGMMAYPNYRYYTDDDSKKRYDGNRWVLTVFTPGGGINFDQMLYFPDQNYPQIGHGGSLQRIGDWAYVHE